MADKPRMVRAMLYEFGAIAAPKNTPVDDSTLWLGLKAQVLDEHGETHEYVCDPIAFVPVPKKATPKKEA